MHAAPPQWEVQWSGTQSLCSMTDRMVEDFLCGGRFGDAVTKTSFMGASPLSSCHLVMDHRQNVLRLDGGVGRSPDMIFDSSQPERYNTPQTVPQNGQRQQRGKAWEEAAKPGMLRFQPRSPMVNEHAWPAFELPSDVAFDEGELELFVLVDSMHHRSEQALEGLQLLWSSQCNKGGRRMPQNHIGFRSLPWTVTTNHRDRATEVCAIFCHPISLPSLAETPLFWLMASSLRKDLEALDESGEPKKAKATSCQTSKWIEAVPRHFTIGLTDCLQYDLRNDAESYAFSPNSSWYVYPPDDNNWQTLTFQLVLSRIPLPATARAEKPQQQQQQQPQVTTPASPNRFSPLSSFHPSEETLPNPMDIEAVGMIADESMTPIPKAKRLSPLHSRRRGRVATRGLCGSDALVGVPNSRAASFASTLTSPWYGWDGWDEMRTQTKLLSPDS
ncbi:hypothetical protein SODALDRAFT_361317 [Sodiomyces alkalinus F11]|uniref:Uncharacterized protein n=1 Tax=Sodiomyces alkalinus (strain CBS 110278 / VKM F-3762 / F11) TaxID=1314773 RepID=A0A3N2PSZ5_SODAK|nr:hypothetical protein SODALDRAFT_361317 [Sodiomyces alkalinus F11]ROT37598.1 hypothetical protein SODALDRAFT_361317 [Sodiomyces alkalinus F11]